MKLSFTCLGGVGEIGMNCYVYETDKSAIIIDAGVKFTDGNISGVDFMIPDFAYLKKIKDKLKAVVFTHGHEDHIGAAAFLLEQFDLPVIADRYTADMIDNKLAEHKIKAEKIYFDSNLTPIEIADFTLTAIPVSHSIQSTKAIHIKIKDGFSLLHISDYKVDFATNSSDCFNIKPFMKLTELGLDCLISDSTNSLNSGFTKSEKSIKRRLDNIIRSAEGRVFFTTFSSNTERLGMVFDIAEQCNKKLVIEGSSLIRNLSIARKHSFINVNSDNIIMRKQMEKFNDNEIVVIASGSQGEATSVMSKISHDDYGLIDVRASDTFIFSSRVIPGNEAKIIKILNNLAKRGAKIIVDNDHDIHSSGHANSEDIKFLIKLLKPNYLIPIHGEDTHLNKHKEIAVSNSLLDSDSVLISGIGKKINFIDSLYINTKTIEVSKKYVDNFSSEILTSDDILSRMRLVGNGAITIVVIADIKIGNLARKPIITTVGFMMDEHDKKNLISYIISAVDNEIFERMVLSSWEEFIFITVKKYFKKLYNRRPLISIYVGE